MVKIGMLILTSHGLRLWNFLQRELTPSCWPTPLTLPPHAPQFDSGRLSAGGLLQRGLFVLRHKFIGMRPNSYEARRLVSCHASLYPVLN